MKKNLNITIAIGGVLLTALYAFTLQKLFEIEFPFSLLESLSLVGPLAISAKIALAAMGYFRPSDFRAITILIIGFILSLMVVSVQHLIVQPIYDEHLSDHFIQVGWRLHFLVAFLVNSSGLTISLFWNELRDQTAYMSRRKEAHELNREAELLMLRHQLQPHFLFNSLNSINALIGQKPEKAREMIHQLGTFLRGTIRIDDQKPISFSTEMEQIQLYLNIEKVRFGHRLDIETTIDDEAAKSSIPPLLLQPLLENAIKFGLYGTSEAVHLALSARIEMNSLLIEITNPIDEDAESLTGTGFGLQSVQRRLYLTYGQNDLVKVQQDDQLFKVTLKIPQ